MFNNKTDVFLQGIRVKEFVVESVCRAQAAATETRWFLKTLIRSSSEVTLYRMDPNRDKA